MVETNVFEEPSSDVFERIYQGMNETQKRNEIGRIKSALRSKLLAIRQWPTYPDSINPSMNEKELGEILREAFTQISVEYAEKFNPD